MAGTEIFRPLRELRTVLHQGLTGQAAAAGINALLDEPVTAPGAPARNAPSPPRSGGGFGRGCRNLPQHRLRRRGLRLPRRPARRASGPVLQHRRRRARRHRRPQRLRQVHHRPPAAAPARSAERRGAHRRPRPARARPGGGAPDDRRGGPGHLPVPRHDRGQPASRLPRRQRGRPRRRRPRRQRARLHRGAARRLPDGDRRARRAPVRRPAPAHRHRPRAAARRADPGAGRGAVLGGRGERGGDPAGAGPADGRAHHADPGAPPVQRDQRRPHPGAGRRRGGGERPPRRTDRARRPVSPADGAAARRTRRCDRAARRPCGAGCRAGGGRPAPWCATSAQDAAEVGWPETIRALLGLHPPLAAPACGHRVLRHRPRRRLHRRRRARRADHRRGAGQCAVVAAGRAAARRGAGGRAAALARIVPGARHGVPPAGGDARRSVPQAGRAGARLSAASAAPATWSRWRPRTSR